MIGDTRPTGSPMWWIRPWFYIRPLKRRPSCTRPMNWSDKALSYSAKAARSKWRGGGVPIVMKVNTPPMSHGEHAVRHTQNLPRGRGRDGWENSSSIPALLRCRNPRPGSNGFPAISARTTSIFAKNISNKDERCKSESRGDW